MNKIKEFKGAIFWTENFRQELSLKSTKFNYKNYCTDEILIQMFYDNAEQD